MLVGRMIHHELSDDLQTIRMRLLDEHLKIVQGAVVRVHIAVVRNSIAIITEGRGVKRQKPEGRHAEITQIGQLLNKSLEITDAIAIAVTKGPHVEFVNDGVLVPERLWLHLRKLSVSHQSVYSFPAWYGCAPGAASATTATSASPTCGYAAPR